MSTGLKELKVWQEAVALAADVVRLGRAGARRETRAITDRLMNAGADVPTQIAAGYAHDSPGRQLGFYVAAREALVEVETLLAVGRQSGVLPTDAVLAAAARAGAVHRLLGGYVGYVERQLAESAAAADERPAATAAPTLDDAAD